MYSVIISKSRYKIVKTKYNSQYVIKQALTTSGFDFGIVEVCLLINFYHYKPSKI